MVMEAENSQSALYSLRVRKAGGVIPFVTKGPNPGATESGAGRDRGPSLRRESKLALLLPFYFTQVRD